MKTLKEIMTRSVHVVRPETPIEEVARDMRRLDTGVIPVCDGNKVRGMITDRDIVIRGIAEGKAAEGLRAADVMTSAVHWLYDDQALVDATEVMKRERVRRIIVMDRAKRLVGIVSLGDLAAEADEEDLHGETLEQISKAGRPREKNLGTVLGSTAGVVVVSGLLAAAGYFLLKKRPGSVSDAVREGQAIRPS
jgi:CBS domain-containing protein